MNKQLRTSMKLGILSGLMLTLTTSVQAQLITEVESNPLPNKVFAVQCQGEPAPHILMSKQQIL